MDNYLNILQYNIQSLQSKKSLLQNLLIEKNIDVCLLNETWFKANSIIPHFPSYNIIYKNSINTHNGVAILVSHRLKYKVVNTHFSESIQNLCITIETQFGAMAILCVYCPPSIRFDSAKLKDLINDIPKPCIVMGDFNAHNIAFGCHSDNNRGRCLFNIIDELDLCILNDGSPTTVPYPNRQASAIDLALVSSSIAHLCNWYVHDDPMGSYHLPTLLEINIQPSMYDSSPPINQEKYIYSKADWDEYYSLSETCFFYLNSIDDSPINLYNQFIETLNDLRNKTIPKRTLGANTAIKKPVPWWNTKCSDAVAKSKEALKDYFSQATIENWIRYKKLDAKKKRILKEESSTSWQNLCSSFNRLTPVSRIWGYIKKFKKIGTNRNKNINDEWVPSFLDNMEDSTEIDVNRLEYLFEHATENDVNVFLKNNFIIEELLTSVKSRKDTTPGLDDIPYMLIKKLHLNAQTTLLKIFNKLWDELVIPESWKTQCVIPILKPNKPVNRASSYRPISLSSCLGKIFENMIKLRLDYFVESQSLIPSIQFGFRKGKSCSESFVSLLCDVRQVKLSHSNAICVFLDVKGAFDNVNIEELIQVSHDIGLPGHVLKWLYSFLNNRTVFVKYNNKLHGPRTVNKGTMQGATSSPLLYNIYTSEILRYVVVPGVNILQFADDLLLYSINQNIDIAMAKINEALSQLYSYYHSKLKLEINPEKSSVLIISKNVNIHRNVKISYNGVEIPVVKQHKFLGVIIDDKLKFDEHVKHICSKALKGINLLRHLAGSFWGSDPKVMSMLYKSIVRSHFDYSSLAYMNASSTLLRKLDVIQNMGLRLICGAMRTTPINSLEVETCIPPLILRRLLLAERFLLKVMSSNDNILLKKLTICSEISQSMASNTISASSLVGGTLPEIPTIFEHVNKNSKDIVINNIWPLYKIPYNGIFNSFAIHLNTVHNEFDFLQFKDNRPEHYVLYTDGSKTDHIVNAAFYDPQLDFTKCIKLNKICSIFTAECYAIYCALQHVNSLVNNVQNILIVSDSRSVLSALNNVNITFKLNYIIFNIRLIILKLYDKYIKVEFVWVPSHSGIRGNEVADAAACSDHDEDRSELLKVPFTDYYSLYNELNRRFWKEYWDITQETKGRWYAGIQNELSTKPWYLNFKYITRRFITVISRMRLGHCLTPAHLNRMHIINNSRCHHCGAEDADLDHVILKCSSFNIQRLILVSELSELNDSDIENESVPRCVQELLRNKKYFIVLYKYICNTVEKI